MPPPILLIHGACSQASHMEAWVRHFREAGYEIAAPSLPGHGPSDTRILARTEFADYVEAARQIQARFKRPSVVIGHSMGGLIAQHLAATTDCVGLVLIASVPPFVLTARLNAMRHFPPVVLRILRGRPFRPSTAGLVDLTLHDVPVAEREALLPDFSAESGLAFRAMAFGRARVEPEAVTCPVLSVSGSADRLIPQRVYRRIARIYRADEIVIPGRGHWLVATDLVETVAERVRAWIEALPPAAPPLPPRPSFAPAVDV